MISIRYKKYRDSPSCPVEDVCIAYILSNHASDDEDPREVLRVVTNILGTLLEELHARGVLSKAALADIVGVPVEDVVDVPEAT